MSLPRADGGPTVLKSVARSVVKVIGWTLAYAYQAFVIVASVIAAFCGIAVVAFIFLEGYAILTGNG